MSSTYTPVIILEFYKALFSQYGMGVAENYMRLLNQWPGSKEFPTPLNEAENVNYLNDFLRTHLNHIPNTTEVRAWLVSTNSIEAYLAIFRKDWSNLLIDSGIFNDEQVQT